MGVRTAAAVQGQLESSDLSALMPAEIKRLTK